MHGIGKVTEFKEHGSHESCTSAFIHSSLTIVALQNCTKEHARKLHQMEGPQRPTFIIAFEPVFIRVLRAKVHINSTKNGLWYYPESSDESSRKRRFHHNCQLSPTTPWCVAI
eukprot:TRINITY_DN2328_c0_g1_i2.p1 TRINITY_DN2328_c0_g1~~TRINITY_DN2328_c0_g1_i2.p1  ORF type:complete len:113 (-),score=5.96 TRINITY_DN2328_c0_g1_i2:103-441(-)